MKTTSNSAIADESGKILDLGEEALEWAIIDHDNAAALVAAIAADPGDAREAGLSLAYGVRESAAQRLHRAMVEDAREFERWNFFLWKDGTWCRLQLVEVKR